MENKGRNRGRFLFDRAKPVLNLLIFYYSLFPLKTRIYLFSRARMIKGKLGLAIRYSILKNITSKCGNNVTIHENVYLLNPTQLIVGENVSVHPFCYIDATGGIEIGNDVSIAHGVSILSSSHAYEASDLFIKDQPIVLKRTVIEDDVWICAKATIVAGIRLAKRCIIAANSVVTKDVDSNTIVGGVPAKEIKKF